MNKAFGLAISMIAVLGCTPEPYFPRTEYGTSEEVVVRPVSPNTVKLREGELFEEGSKVAVFQFQSPDMTQGGALVSDMFSSLLQEQGFSVVERDNIDSILREQNLVGENRTSLSDLQVADRLGKLTAADYMVFGSVTLYQAEPQTIYIPIRVKEEDRNDYEEEYSKYRRSYLNSWDFWVPRERKIKRLREEANVFSLSEIETELTKTSKQEFRVIASVGISAKVVDVRRGEIIWLGQGETNDFTTVNATQRILNEFIKSIQSE
jgi:hypothetical protein